MQTETIEFSRFLRTFYHHFKLRDEDLVLWAKKDHIKRYKLNVPEFNVNIFKPNIALKLTCDIQLACNQLFRIITDPKSLLNDLSFYELHCLGIGKHNLVNYAENVIPHLDNSNVIKLSLLLSSSNKELLITYFKNIIELHDILGETYFDYSNQMPKLIEDINYYYKLLSHCYLSIVEFTSKFKNNLVSPTSTFRYTADLISREYVSPYVCSTGAVNILLCEKDSLIQSAVNLVTSLVYFTCGYTKSPIKPVIYLYNVISGYVSKVYINEFIREEAVSFFINNLVHKNRLYKNDYYFNLNKSNCYPT